MVFKEAGVLGEVRGQSNHSHNKKQVMNWDVLILCLDLVIIAVVLRHWWNDTN